MVETCPHCGSILPEPESKFHLTPSERKVYDYIAKHPKCETNHIISHMYGGRGPEYARLNIHVFVNRINKKLLDHRIQSSARGPGATYSLVKVLPNASF